MTTPDASVGSRICLVSNHNIRYEGMLHNIDAEENTVSLTNVRIYGTEGRKNGLDEVPPSDQLFEYIVFRGADIRDLTLFEKKSEERPLNADPAVIKATPARGGAGAVPMPRGGVNASANSTNNNNTPGFSTGRGFYDNPSNPRDAGNNNRRGGLGGNYGGNNNNHHGGGGRYSRGGSGGGRGGNFRRRQDGHTGQDFRPATGSAKEEFKEDFDFTKSREEFEKKKNEFEKAKEDVKNQPKAYSKSFFFDTISCDQKDRNQGRRMDRDDMRKADTETFGSEMVGSMRGFRRGRGGRGRYQRY